MSSDEVEKMTVGYKTDNHDKSGDLIEQGSIRKQKKLLHTNFFDQ